MTVWDDLRAVQAEVHAPRNEESRFGMARSAEGILAAAKPVCHTHGLMLKCTDTVVEVGGRTYVKATALVKDKEGNTESADAWACEGDVDRGLDASQVTGKASSYARKYALQGLFALDDRKDADTEQAHPRMVSAHNPVPATDAQVKKIHVLLSSKHPGLSREAKLEGLVKLIGRDIGSSKDLTMDEASDVIKALSK